MPSHGRNTRQGTRDIQPGGNRPLTNSPIIEDEIVDMAALLDSGGAPEPRSLRRGEVVEGIVMGPERDGVLVDLVEIGSKSEGIIPLNEMHSLGADPASKLAAGEKVLV